jgi:hypothetical protein
MSIMNLAAAAARFAAVEADLELAREPNFPLSRLEGRYLSR